MFVAVSVQRKGETGGLEEEEGDGMLSEMLLSTVQHRCVHCRSVSAVNTLCLQRVCDECVFGWKRDADVFDSTTSSMEHCHITIM